MNMNNLSNRSKAIILTLICIVLWAFIPVVSKIWQNTLDNYQFLFYSSIFSLLVIFVGTTISWNYDYTKRQISNL